MVQGDGDEAGAGQPLGEPGLIAPEPAIAMRKQRHRMRDALYGRIFDDGHADEDLVSRHRRHRRGLCSRIPDDRLDARYGEGAEADGRGFGRCSVGGSQTKDEKSKKAHGTSDAV